MEDKVKEIKEEFKKDLNSKWEQERKDGDITIYKAKASSGPSYIYKGETTFKLKGKDSVRETWNLLQNWNHRIKWDVSINELSKELKSINEFTSIDYSVTNPALGGVISSRDFVDLRSWENQDDGGIFGWSKSIEYEEKPAQKGYVRGFNYACGIVIEKVTDQEWKLTVVWHTDLKGMLLSSVVNSAMPSSMCTFITNFKKHLATTDL